MGIQERPEVILLPDGAKFWEHTYDDFYLKAYIPPTDIKGQVNNYGFRAPLLTVFEEEPQSIVDAACFARNSGLADIASANDTAVLFVYPTCEGGWANADEQLYRSFIAEVKMDPKYADGIVELIDFFTQEFKGYFIRGAKFRTDIYSFGASADYVAKNLLKKIEGEFLWGPGDITPAMCSMEGLSVMPEIERYDIPVISAFNSDEINEAFDKCEHVLIKEEADYIGDFMSFVRRYKMWCGKIELEPDFDELEMVEEAASITVNTSPDNLLIKDEPTHEAGYFAYYNKGLLEKGNVPLMLGFHGGGDSSMYLTFVAEWWEVAHRNDFLFVSVENHQYLPASEVMQLLEHLKSKYPIDEKRIYATGFSMGCAKTWDLYHEYPEHFAGFCPASALFPVKNNPFGKCPSDPGFNLSKAVPFFYSGGEDSPLPELPFQNDGSLERALYLAKTNDFKTSFDDIKFEEKDSWEHKVYGHGGQKSEKIYDDSRDSYLTVDYYESKDGVIRTALASISGQGHECRPHTCENAWKFISQFTL
ncbi:MAG: hypothetical protein MJ103_05525 [Saccharofermentans sp.]|nr:hypothetical protein [Saccharofermentans sp.]